jgi:hypothetical protein
MVETMVVTKDHMMAELWVEVKAGQMDLKLVDSMVANWVAL